MLRSIWSTLTSQRKLLLMRSLTVLWPEQSSSYWTFTVKSPYIHLHCLCPSLNICDAQGLVSSSFLEYLSWALFPWHAPLNVIALPRIPSLTSFSSHSNSLRWVHLLCIVSAITYWLPTPSSKCSAESHTHFLCRGHANLLWIVLNLIYVLPNRAPYSFLICLLDLSTWISLK